MRQTVSGCASQISADGQLVVEVIALRHRGDRGSGAALQFEADDMQTLFVVFFPESRQLREFSDAAGSVSAPEDDVDDFAFHLLHGEIGAGDRFSRREVVEGHRHRGNSREQQRQRRQLNSAHAVCLLK